MRLLFPLLLLACTAPNRAQSALEDRGYTEIDLIGYAPFACSEDDTFATSFKARSPGGDRKVHGTVCCGLLKGCTVRTR